MWQLLRATGHVSAAFYMLWGAERYQKPAGKNDMAAAAAAAETAENKKRRKKRTVAAARHDNLRIPRSSFGPIFQPETKYLLRGEKLPAGEKHIRACSCASFRTF